MCTRKLGKFYLFKKIDELNIAPFWLLLRYKMFLTRHTEIHLS